MEAQETPQEETPQESQPQQPSIDPRAAIEIAAQQYGVTPEFLDGALRLQEENRRFREENMRAKRELELERVRIEALAQERQRYLPQQPSYDNLDPVTRTVVERLDRIDQRFEEEQRRRVEMETAQVEAQRTGEELFSHYSAVMRTVPSQNQMDAERFFAGMQELWPDGPPAGMSPERAVNVTARFLGIAGTAPFPQQQSYQNGRSDRRMALVIPGGSVSPTQETTGRDDEIGQRPGETLDQYNQRIGRALAARGVTKLREGQRSSSG